MSTFRQPHHREKVLLDMIASLLTRIPILRVHAVLKLLAFSYSSPSHIATRYIPVLLSNGFHLYTQNLMKTLDYGP